MVLSYKARRDAYLDHIKSCHVCRRQFLVTREPCFEGCCPNNRVSYWTVRNLCSQALALAAAIVLLTAVGCAHKPVKKALPLDSKVHAQFHGISLAGQCEIATVTFDAKTRVYDVYCRRDDVPYPHF